MTQAVRYEFVGAPVALVSHAWRQYKASRLADRMDGCDVHFVPAAGGCFVVAVLEPERRAAFSLATAVRLLGPSAEVVAQRLLARFKHEFERTQKAAGRRPRVVVPG
jgi:hypothetical protein